MALRNSYTYGQSGYGNPLYANNYNPNMYTYGDPYAGVGMGNAVPANSVPSNIYATQGQTGNNPGLINPNQLPMGEVEAGAGNKGAATAGKVTAGINAALQTAQTASAITQDFKQTSEFDVQDSVQFQQYAPRSAPPMYVKEAMPEQISEGTGGRAALKYAGMGASTGASVGTLFGPIGTAVGAGVGALGGAVVGAFKGKAAKRKREEFLDRQKQAEANYRAALGRYYDIQNNARTQQARAQQLSQRGQNIAPMYGASIYGIGNY